MWVKSFGLLLVSFDSDILPDEDVYQRPNRSGFVSLFPPVLRSSSLSLTVLCRHVGAFIQAHTQHKRPPLALTTWNILNKCFSCRNPRTDTPNFHHNKRLRSSKHAAPVWSDHRGGQCLWACFCRYANFLNRVWVESKSEPDKEIKLLSVGFNGANRWCGWSVKLYCTHSLCFHVVSYHMMPCYSAIMVTTSTAHCCNVAENKSQIKVCNESLHKCHVC